ncbi:YjeO family protein [Winslowiella arboricola]|uniref:YjeO family protein n=1 Tax=Winslowiella arboricola TaxID=2978220 RepID=UPI00389A4466
MNIWKLLCLLVYSLFCAVIIDMFSFLDYEEMVGQGEITNVCVVLRTLVMDDTRDVLAPLAFLLISPLFYLVAKKKLKSWPINIITMLLFIFWLWRFFLRFKFC